MTSHRRKARKRRSLTQREKSAICEALNDVAQLDDQREKELTELIRLFRKSHVIVETTVDESRVTRGAYAGKDALQGGD